MAKITGSYNRSKRKSKKNPTTSKGRANRQSVSKAKVTDAKTPINKGKAKVTGGSKVKTPKTSITMGGDTGRRGGTNQPAKPSSKVPTQGRPSATRVGQQLSKAARRVPGIGQAVTAISAGAAIGEYMKNNVKKNTSGSGRGSGRKAFAGTKPASKPASSKPKMKPTPGMSKDAVKAAKEGAAKANANKKTLKVKSPVKPSKPAKSTSAPKAAKKPATKPSTPQSRAYAKDSRNKDYDKLRNSGKTKEAEKLGKAIFKSRKKK